MDSDVGISVSKDATLTAVICKDDIKKYVDHCLQTGITGGTLLMGVCVVG